jgi:phosphoribosylformimino-5-aminoimidazole carboxamide ribotide isomerase
MYKRNNNRFRLIPAIDIIGGECVRLSMGDYGQVTKYSSSPAMVAGDFEKMGFDRIHIVDLDGAKSAEPSNLQALRDIAAATGLVIQFGGGIKSMESAQRAFDSGAHSVIVGSVAVKDPGLVCRLLERYGNKRIILGIDIKEGKIAINGWKEQINSNIDEFIKSYTSIGITKIICTDISKDGMLSGPAFDLYMELRTTFPSLEIIASGGVSGMEDIIALEEAGLDGVVVGKAFYEKKIDLKKLESWLQNE